MGEEATNALSELGIDLDPTSAIGEPWAVVLWRKQNKNYNKTQFEKYSKQHINSQTYVQENLEKLKMDSGLYNESISQTSKPKHDSKILDTIFSTSTKRSKTLDSFIINEPKIESIIVFEGKAFVRNYTTQSAPAMSFSTYLHPKTSKYY